MTTATVFNIQRFSLHDGPGIRTTVFLKGCPLRCLWCHNPESMAPQKEPVLNANHCMGCEECLPVCSEGLTGRLDMAGGPGYPGSACLRCGSCADACPTGARLLLGEDYSVQQLLDEVSRDGVYHRESSGGMTFSGGEPLTPANAPFVLACLEQLADRGVHTAVDTCGHVPTKALLEAAELADLMLYDLKLMDPVRHLEATGRDNGLILENLRALLDRGDQVWIRIPLIPGQNDDDENLLAIADFLASSGHRAPVSLLPYHDTGGDKYRRLGRTNAMQHVPAMTESRLAAIVSQFAGRGIYAQVGG